MNSLPFLRFFCVIFAMAIVSSEADENGDMDKRYVAALAKNGRLPKFENAQKKDGSQEDVLSSSEDPDDDDSLFEDKRHYGVLKLHGKSRSSGSEKRNVASMARLGKLNSARLFKVGRKRISEEVVSNNNEDNSLSLFDCMETEDDDRPIWVQKKRYVAALARSGRLPIWHSQRMWWGGKRDNDMPLTKNKKCKRNVAAMARNGKLPFRA